MDTEDLTMNRKLNVTVAVVAGLLGGLVSRYLTPIPVFAKVQAPIPREIRAQKFVIVNEQGAAQESSGLTATVSPWSSLPMRTVERFGVRSRLSYCNLIDNVVPKYRTTQQG
jgi:hypothetical protein